MRWNLIMGRQIAPQHRHLQFVWNLKVRQNVDEYRLMDKSVVFAKLRAHEPELKAAGISRLSLFGSVARGDANAESDWI
jgi:hypothetical protein